MLGLWQSIPAVGQSALVTTAMGVLNVGGSLCFKAYVAGSGTGWMIGGFATWGFGALLFLQLLRLQDLAIVGIASSVIQVCLVITAGVLIFGESLSARQAFATAIAIAAMTVAMLPSPQT